LSEKETLTGGVAVALTTKEPFLEDGSDFAPKLCLTASAAKVRDDDDTRACVAMFFPSLLPLLLQQ
jgi:hypothetical protein